MSDITTNPTQMSKVNLDALIPKEDFITEGGERGKQTKMDKLRMSDLLPKDKSLNSLYHLLKKPDFQRETCEWNTKRIYDLIKSFIERDFIPSIIIWENKETGKIFVIDGAHRVSALLAYINDDYGDRHLSQQFYGYNQIPDEELTLAEETREYINDNIGSFKTIMEEGGEKADGMIKGYFDVQEIEGDVQRAEDSFFKINQQGVILSPAEKTLCKGRKYPSCLATRIIMKGGAASQYWVNFEAKHQQTAKSVGSEINELIFTPQYKAESKSVILHHPLAANITGALPMIIELMKMIKKKYKNDKEKEDNYNGAETCEYLLRARKIIWQILSEQNGSLGLFPSVYFYNSSGAYLQSSFLGVVHLLLENDNDETFLPRLTKARGKMELFIIEHKVFLTQINKHYGSRERSYRHFKGFFSKLIDYFSEHSDYPPIIAALKKQYDFLNENESDFEKPKSRKFSPEQKTAFGNKEELLGMPKCKLCHGFLHPLSKSFDHIEKRGEGGGSEMQNAQTTHYYCNNSRDMLIERGVFPIL